MDRPLCWINDSAGLARAVAALGPGPLAVDTEADSFHHYPEKLCLLQISVGEQDLLVDPLTGLDMGPLLEQLADGGRIKILHGADYDLRMIDRAYGARVHGLFDTMIAARLTGEPALGLAALVDKYLGVQLDKQFQRADWSERPLPEPMQRYAVLDTCHLETLAAVLRERLEELERSTWAEEEFRRVEQLPTRAPRKPVDFRRVKVRGKLDRRQLGVLRALFELREQEAVRRDRPPFKILRDELLVDMARQASPDPADLERLKGLPPRWRRASGLGELGDAIRGALELPESELPELPRRERRERPPASFDRRVKELAAKRDALARELELEPAVLAPRALIEDLVSREQRGSAPGDAEELRRWQAELLLPLL